MNISANEYDDLMMFLLLTVIDELYA